MFIRLTKLDCDTWSANLQGIALLLFRGMDERWHLSINRQMSTLVCDTLADAMNRTAAEFAFLRVSK